MSVPPSVWQAFIDFALELQVDREQVFLLARKGKALPRWASVKGGWGRGERNQERSTWHIPFTWEKLVLIIYKTVPREGQTGGLGQGLLSPSLLRARCHLGR